MIYIHGKNFSQSPRFLARHRRCIIPGHSAVASDHAANLQKTPNKSSYRGIRPPVHLIMKMNLHKSETPAK